MKIIKSLIHFFERYHSLLFQSIKRDVIGRYKGSYLGVLWSIVTPLLMLLVYTFVFGTIFHSKWNVNGGNKVTFALVMFSGITTFNIFAEVVTRASTIIIDNANYVKRVVYPLQLLPIIILGSSLVNASIGFVILIVGIFSLSGAVSWTVVLIPVVLIPLVLVSLGMGWLLASLGVFIRDIGQFIGISVQALIFLTPVFFPMSAVPRNLRIIYQMNPLSYVVDNVQRVAVWGHLPNWTSLVYGVCYSSVIAFIGYLWFQKTRGEFADAL